MKSKMIVLGLGLTIILSACGTVYQQFAVDTSVLTVEVNLLKIQYAKVESILRDLQLEKNIFSETEWEQLSDVDSTIDMLVDKIDGIIQFQSNSISLADVEFMWGLSVEGYNRAKSVISAHKDEIPPSSWALLDAFDSQAEVANTRINELLTNPDNSNIKEALVLITGIISIAVKMLSVATI